MTFKSLKPALDKDIKSMSKGEFISFCLNVDGRTRVGGPVGKGRITAKRALALLAA